MKEFCFLCGKEIKGNPKIVYTEDDNQAIQFVGAGCYKQIVKSGTNGVPQKMLYGLKGVKLFATKELAQRSQDET